MEKIEIRNLKSEIPIINHEEIGFEFEISDFGFEFEISDFY